MSPYIVANFFSRGAGTIDFGLASQPTFTPPADSPNSVLLGAGNFEIPNTKTTYGCRYFDLSSVISPIDDRHITAVDVVLDPGTSALVHHLLVHVCSSAQTQWNSMEKCISPTGTVCNTLVYAWAVGGGPLIVPQEAGFRMGTSADDIQHIVLEIHYDNPALVSGRADDSGVVVYYTNSTNARANDASTVVLGDPFVTFPSIPAATGLHHLEGVCPGSCTKKRLGNATLNVFGSFLHMHSFGRQIYTSKTSAGELNRADSWNFEFQQITEVSYTINPGDSLHTHCTFDSSNSDNDVNFGLASEEVESTTPFIKEQRISPVIFITTGNVYGLPFLLSEDSQFRTLRGRATSG